MNRYPKNQKGIVWVPIMIWSIVISGSIFIAQDAVKRGYITIDSPNILKQTPSPQPTISPTPLPVYQPTPAPIPTKSPSQGQVQRLIQNNQNTQTTQGRTGRIVKYKEYCKGGKEISVYESELITKKAADGNTYSMTKDDWDCSERDQKQKQNPPTQPATINCYDPVTKKNYQVSKETCDKWVQEYNQTPSYTPPQYYSCTICYHYSFGDNCYTYDSLYKTKEECDAQQQKINQIGNTTPTPTPDNSVDQHNAQVTSCQSSVRSRYEGLLQSCNQYGGGSSGQACRQIYTDQRQREYDACGTLY